ncbi:dynein regulatory complex protein 8 [Egretta garzetta]|nr:dynein regulatory complex protein 8 [Egretta garzetta]
MVPTSETLRTYSKRKGMAPHKEEFCFVLRQKPLNLRHVGQAAAGSAAARTAVVLSPIRRFGEITRSGLETSHRVTRGGLPPSLRRGFKPELLFIWSKHRIKVCSNEENEAEEKLSSLPHIKEQDRAVAEIEKKIIEAFEVFDHECNKTVDVREIGSIVRSLGCFPTEAELHELLAKVEEEEPTGYIHLEKFLPVMTKVLLDRSYRPIPEDVLLHAFEALDENKCGYITKEDLVKYLTEEGEPFTQEEMEDMLSTALDPETNTVRYRDYISMMIVDES